MKRSNPMYSYLHTKQRMEERYNYKNLSEPEYKTMCLNCKNYTKLNTEVTPKGNQYTYWFKFKGMEVIAVYQDWKKQISTVLPMGTKIKANHWK
jgi:hypothetical protein